MITVGVLDTLLWYLILATWHLFTVVIVTCMIQQWGEIGANTTEEQTPDNDDDDDEDLMMMNIEGDDDDDDDDEDEFL